MATGLEQMQTARANSQPSASQLHLKSELHDNPSQFVNYTNKTRLDIGPYARARTSTLLTTK